MSMANAALAREVKDLLFAVKCRSEIGLLSDRSHGPRLIFYDQRLSDGRRSQRVQPFVIG